jgi:hypothetical protein
MRSATWKISIIASISILAVLVIREKNQGCSFGPWDDCESANYSFFDPKIIDRTLDAPFFVSCHTLDENYEWDDSTTSLDLLNACEWSEYLKGKLTKEDVRQIFGLDIEYADSVLNASTILPGGYLSQHEMEALRKKVQGMNQKQEAEYFLFSKKIEKLMFFRSDWDYKEKRLDTAFYISYIDAGQKAIKKSRTEFLRKRYAFQVQRLLFYLNRYDEAIAWYKSNFEQKKFDNSIAYRSLAFYAGSLYHKKIYAEANYLFSLIFDRFPQMRIEAFASFHPWEDADWNSTLALAKSTREKEVLWQLFGIYADPLKGMEEIYALNPKSELLDLLMTRAINITEKEKLVNTDYNNYMNQYNEEPATSEMVSSDQNPMAKVFDSSVSFRSLLEKKKKDALTAFFKKVTVENKTHAPGIWLNAAAYFAWLTGDNSLAESYLEKLRNNSSMNNANKSQLAITEVLVNFSKLSNLTPENENKLGRLLLTMDQTPHNERATAVIPFLKSKLFAIYKAQGNHLMAELSGTDSRDYYKTEFHYDEMLKFMRHPSFTPMESYLLSHYRINSSKIIEYKAIKELQKNNIDEAIRWFAQDPNSGSAELYGNPFNIHIVDCHDCDHEAPQNMKYTKYSFALKLRELLQAAETSHDSMEKAQNYFLFANGLYNLTYYGNARMVTENNISYTDYYEDEYYSGNSKDPYEEGGCEAAQEYYEKALAWSTNREFSAKCAWMCAKCELNNFYATGDYESGNKDFIVGDYFKMMKTRFSDTHYYQEAIQECGYFCTYAGGVNCIRVNGY